MKRTLLKSALFALYVATLLAARTNADLFGPFGASLVMIVLGYCGIIVIAHLVAAVVSLCNWLTLVIGREPQPDTYNAVVELDVETEAI